MKKKHASELYASLAASNVESNSSDFEVLSLRISHESQSMVQALTVAFQRPALTLFTNGISEQLAYSLRQSVENEPLILEEAVNGVQPDSALDLLLGAGAIQYDDEKLRRIRRMSKDGE